MSNCKNSSEEQGVAASGFSSLLPMSQYQTYNDYCVSRTKIGLDVAPMSLFVQAKEGNNSLDPKYNEKAVEQEIKKDPRIKGKEAKLIHALLKGWG